jgi:hypothetical protein
MGADMTLVVQRIIEGLLVLVASIAFASFCLRKLRRAREEHQKINEDSE